MTGASDTLDPIAAAEAGIAGSKHLIAAVADDLSQQAALACALSGRRTAPRAAGQGLGADLLARSQAPAPGALVAARGPDRAPLGADRCRFPVAHRHCPVRHSPPHRHRLLRLGAAARLCARAHSGGMDPRIVGLGCHRASAARARHQQCSGDCRRVDRASIQNSRGDGAALADRRLGLDPDRGRTARPRRHCERIDRCSVERGAVAGTGNLAPARDDSARLVDAEENRSFLPRVSRHRIAGFLLGETGRSARGREPSRAGDQALYGVDLVRATARAPARTQRGRRVTAG